MTHKSEAIDILKLYSNCNTQRWNRFLKICFLSHDVSALVDVLRRLQMGMNNLVEQKLNTDKVNQLFIRLQRSVENTIRDIHRAKNPNPLFASSDKSLQAIHLADKKQKQAALENFLHKARY